MKTEALIGRPFELEVAAGKVRDQRAAGTSGEHAGDADGTGAGAAGQGDARAALPGAHGHLALALDLDDVDVHAARESLVVLEQRAERFERKGGDVRDVRDEVRVTHRDGGDGERALADLDRNVDGGLPGRSVGISAATAGSARPCRRGPAARGRLRLRGRA